jgi:GTP cyclohydrolase I
MGNKIIGEVQYMDEGFIVTSPFPVSDSAELEDVQSSPDLREIAIEQVGVSDLQYPITVLDKAQEKQKTVATITLSVGLPHDTKGTHMSRFIEALEQHRGELTVRTIPAVLDDIKRRLDAESARIEVHFPYFLERPAPASRVRALMDYQCSFTGEVDGGDTDFVLGVNVPVTSLCPCSKTISDYGAHNQRGYLHIQTRSNDIVWIEELIDVAEASASAPVYALLKREDERHLTMRAYDTPVFVEDMVRNVAVKLRDDERIAWFRVRADNHESIHNHNAFAQVTWERK